MKKTAICRLDLGQTRTQGYVLFNPQNKEFEETTPKEVKRLVLAGNVNGLKLLDDEIVLDVDGFNCKNLKIKSAVGKYRNMFPCEHEDIKFYAVVRAIDTDNGRLFEVVDNKYARVKIDESRLLMLASFSLVAGVRICNGEIELCNGIIYENRRSMLTDEDLDKLVNSDQVVDFGGQLVKISELKELPKIDSSEVLAGLAEGEQTISSVKSDFNRLDDNLAQNCTSNNELTTEELNPLYEVEDKSKLPVNKFEDENEKVLGAGLYDNLTEKEGYSSTADVEQISSEQKHSIGDRAKAAMKGDEKGTTDGKKNSGKKVSNKAKTK